MRTGTNALKRTVRYWVDAFMHAMATETVTPIATISRTTTWMSVWGRNIKKNFWAQSFLGKLYWWLSMSKLFLCWNYCCSRCHDTVTAGNNHIANIQCSPDFEQFEFFEHAHDCWFRWLDGLSGNNLIQLLKYRLFKYFVRKHQWQSFFSICIWCKTCEWLWCHIKWRILVFWFS